MCRLADRALAVDASVVRCRGEMQVRPHPMTAVAPVQPCYRVAQRRGNIVIRTQNSLVARLSEQTERRLALVNYMSFMVTAMSRKPRTVDHLARGSMKTAANCASSCNPQVMRTSTSRTHIAALVTNESWATPV